MTDRRLALVPLLLVLLVGGAFAAPAPAFDGDAEEAKATADAFRTRWDHWYTVELAGNPAGWMHETMASDGAHHRSSTTAVIRMRRAGTVVSVRMESEFLETDDGRPLRLRFVQDMSLQKVDVTWRFGDDEVEMVTRQGGRELRRTQPRPGVPWLAPMAVHRYVTDRLAAGAAVITYQTIDGENGLTPKRITHTRDGAGEMDHAGRSIPVSVWKTTDSTLPGVTGVTKLSADGHLVYDEVTLPFGRMVMRIATQAEAMAAGAGPAPELMVSLFVPADRPIPDPRRARRAVLTLKTRDGAMPDLPTAGAQRVVIGDDPGVVRLEIDIDDNVPADLDDTSRTEHLAAAAMVDTSDALIGKLAARACRGTSEDPAARAEALRRFVHRHISAKDLDTAFATASETARMRRGDCSEHGVLLCAMLRSQGIPARVATGLIYADTFAGARDIFGWHMWTQAHIDGRWVDYDATLEDRYDAVHVLTGTSTLADGAADAEMSGMLLLLGNLEVEVVSVER